MAMSRDVTIINRRGLHARASAKLAKLATQFDAEITVGCADIAAPGKSILDLLMLAASKGKIVTVTCAGKDESGALDSICALIERGFDESDDDGC